MILSFVKNQTEEICKLAVQQNGAFVHPTCSDNYYSEAKLEAFKLEVAILEAIKIKPTWRG